MKYILILFVAILLTGCLSNCAALSQQPSVTAELDKEIMKLFGGN